MIKIIKNIQERKQQKQIAYLKLMQDNSIQHITVGQVRKTCAPTQCLSIYRYPADSLIECKLNRFINDQYDNHIVVNITSYMRGDILILKIK